MKTSESSTDTSTEGQLMLFAEGSLVSRPPKPGSAQARAMTVGSGRRCIESYGRFVPSGSLLRTLAGLLLSKTEWSSSAAYLTWKPKVTGSRRLIFQLAVSEPRTEDSGSGLLPTPTSGDAKSSGSRNTETSSAKPGISLTDWAREDGGTGRLIPTPDANCWKGGADNQRKSQLNGRLNPRFVAQIMGFPTEWLD